MLPLKKGARYSYEDEKSGAVYYFRYLTGACKGDYDNHNDTIIELMSRMDAVKQYAKKYKVSLDVTPETLTIDKHLIYCNKEMSSINNAFDTCSNNLIDIFLVGWMLPGETEVACDGKPSTMFVDADLKEMASVIKKLLPVLSGEKVEEAKN